jgi:hypothetical protein
MPNFIYIFRGGNARTMSPQEMQDHMAKWGAWIGQLSQKTQYKGGDPLAEGGRVISGTKRAVTDGPFGETKDLVGGYVLITAADLDSAVELARGCPIFETDGSLEVRETREMKM